jgi:CheY-like chemotaxis protein
MFRVQCLTDGCELLPKLKEIGFKCQLILLDEMMKKTNGTTAARELRAYEEENGLPHTPIISLTANATTQDLDRYNNAGINGIILKPFDVKQLASSMNAFLDLASKGTPNTVSVSRTRSSPKSETLDPRPSPRCKSRGWCKRRTLKLSSQTLNPSTGCSSQTLNPSALDAISVESHHEADHPQGGANPKP